MELLKQAENFLIFEARLLDERRFEEWIELFTDDGYYWAPAHADQKEPHSEVSIFFDDRELIRERVRRLRHPRVHSQLPPSRTSHIVTNLSLEMLQEDRNVVGGDVLVRSKLLMCEYRPSLPEGVKRFFSGTCWHSLTCPEGENSGKFCIRWKKVELVDCDAAFEPLAVYF
jgi:3-phenylpropionate/cinnamic acid dioxygenase small subunit